MTTSTRSSTTATNDNSVQQHEATTAVATVGTAATSAATVAALHNSESPNATANAMATTPTTPTTNANRVMQADEDFNIRFVNLVRTHKCLYDKKVPEYRNRDNQEKAWVLISKETRESVIHCKERWRNLRACLSRYIKQQSGSEPQHKPYYLTEHMAFLLPFLKSTRNCLEGNSNLATLYQLSQQNPLQNLYCNNNNSIEGGGFELKQSLSENDDEETIDAFDPAIAASLGLQRVGNNLNAAQAPVSVAAIAQQSGSPALSDTASANTMQNFIPDVQLAESAHDLVYDTSPATPHQHHHGHHHQLPSHYEHTSAKRIKTECEATTTTAGGYYGNGLTVSENTDMEFFRSILPDIAALTPQQRRKFKIGILELIDDVVERYPAQERYNGAANGSGGSSGAGSIGGGRQQRRNSGRDWRK